ncbi:MAG: site-specific integrase [Coriobacteriia bacterium]|nr:site-specific integrase [Coriobacteriia bacterium]
MTIEKRASGKYRVQIWDSTLCRKVHVGTYPSLAAAKNAGRQAEIALRTQGFIVKPKDTTLRELCTTVLRESAQLRSTSRDWYAHALKPALRFFGEGQSVRRMTRESVQQYVAWLKRSGKADKTVNGYVKALGTVLEHAVESGYCDANPVRKLRNLPADKRRVGYVRVLTREEHQRLVGAADDGYRVMFSVWPFIGLRRSEMQGLLWEDVDLESGYLHVRRQLREDSTLDVNLKTQKAFRAVRLSTRVVAELGRWKVECPATPLGLVFPTPKRLPQSSRSQFYKVWKRACAAAGLVGVHPHDMRHTFATWNLEAGENPVWVAAQMGHEKPSMTLDTYSHVLSGHHDAGGLRVEQWYDRQVSVA